MKKLVCILALVVLSCSATLAQKTFSTGQKAVRDNIMSYLKEEGFQPTLDSDGDIKFKRQGDIYFISVSDKDSSPYYVVLSKYFNYGERLTKTKISLYAQEINLYKMVKLIAGDSSFRLESQLFLINSVAFTNIFERLLRAMDAAENEISEIK